MVTGSIGPRRSKGGKKGRKLGRDLAKCKQYRAMKTREKNKLAKIEKHIATHPNDASAKNDANRVGAFA